MPRLASSKTSCLNRVPPPTLKATHRHCNVDQKEMSRSSSAPSFIKQVLTRKIGYTTYIPVRRNPIPSGFILHLLLCTAKPYLQNVSFMLLGVLCASLSAFSTYASKIFSAISTLQQTTTFRHFFMPLHSLSLIHSFEHLS